jgi:hypothetical protein
MIYHYKKIRELPDDLVLVWWAEHPAGQDYAAIVELSRTHEVRTTISEVRRDIRRRLLGRKLLPLDRAPTNEDYAKAKGHWLHLWRDQPLY